MVVIVSYISGWAGGSINHDYVSHLLDLKKKTREMLFYMNKILNNGLLLLFPSYKELLTTTQNKLRYNIM